MFARFQETYGGAIIDRLTGKTVARVAVENIDTAAAGRAVAAIIAALHAEFGPQNAEGR